MRLIATVVCALLLTSGCTGDDAGEATEITFASLDLELPNVVEEFDTVAPPEVPEGFDETRYRRMVDALTIWANGTTFEPGMRDSDDPAQAIGDELPNAIARALDELTSTAVSPRLAVANVFADDVTVLGPPRFTTAWKAAAAEVDGAPALSLKLQTRAAYEVRVGDDGPTRVIGVLRVHELITRTGETGDIGTGFSWQEFGASDCALALEDALRPDGDAAAAVADLSVFIDVADGDDLTMPDLGEAETVDQAYLDRCRAGQV